MDLLMVNHSRIYFSFPKQNRLVLTSSRNNQFVTFMPLNIGYMTWVSSSNHSLTVLHHTRILQQSHFTKIISSSQYLHISSVRTVWSINSIDISSIHERLPNTLHWPSKGNIPRKPFLISWHGSSRSDLSSCTHLPEKKLIWSASRMKPVSISTEIKMFNIAVMFYFFSSFWFRLWPFIPLVEIDSTIMSSNSKNSIIWWKFDMTYLFFTYFMAPFRSKTVIKNFNCSVFATYHYWTLLWYS